MMNRGLPLQAVNKQRRGGIFGGGEGRNQVKRMKNKNVI
jgi:hypothetical protein